VGAQVGLDVGSDGGDVGNHVGRPVGLDVGGFVGRGKFGQFDGNAEGLTEGAGSIGRGLALVSSRPPGTSR